MIRKPFPSIFDYGFPPNQLLMSNYSPDQNNYDKRLPRISKILPEQRHTLFWISNFLLRYLFHFYLFSKLSFDFDILPFKIFLDKKDTQKEKKYLDENTKSLFKSKSFTNIHDHFTFSLFI